MKKASKFFMIVWMLIPAILYAQPKTAPAWSAKFSSAINWQRIHSLGTIIVSTNEALYGVNPADGSISWENKSFAQLGSNMLEEVPGTEFLAITYKVDAKSSIPFQAIVKVLDGKVLFDSQKEGIGVLSRHVLPASGQLLIMGVKQGGELKDLFATIFMYDIQSGKQLWMNDQLFRPEPPKAKGLLGSLESFGAQMSGLQKLTSEPYELNNEFVIITHPGFVMKLRSATGELVWKNAVASSQKAKVFFSPYQRAKTRRKARALSRRNASRSGRGDKISAGD
jgi:outer membrane protein assembly factor BamB